jgi:AraC family transcriptional regulator of adaptative response/methylated-DNA-[protein]-cysteine methyltransferase
MSTQLSLITYGIHKSPFGWCVIGVTQGKICHLSFINHNNKITALRSIKESWPTADIVYNPTITQKLVKKIFAHQSTRIKSPLPLLQHGTAFQRRVWRALQRIPFGRTATYSSIARTIDSPNAARAVGSACGKNNIAWLIPCHRVVTAQGKLGGYRCGSKRKAAMLAWEQR